jgi:hypothetical protein
VPSLEPSAGSGVDHALKMLEPWCPEAQRKVPSENAAGSITPDLSDRVGVV